MSLKVRNPIFRYARRTGYLIHRAAAGNFRLALNLPFFYLLIRYTRMAPEN